MKYSVPYGKKTIVFSVPSQLKIQIASLKKLKPIANFETKIANVLENPKNSKALLELAKNKKSACVVVTDITRNCPDNILLPMILQILEKEIPQDKIKILIANGMHRKMTRDEKIMKYGKKIVESYSILNHDASEEKNLIYLGKTKNDTPIWISKFVNDSDLLISTGVVEPHQYGGYSGGSKTIAIGVAGDKTITHTHSIDMIRHPKTGLGSTSKNPFHEDVIEIGKKVGINFIINVVLGPNNEILAIQAGEPIQTHIELIARAKETYEVPIKQISDVAICGVGYPKDSNLYQASRAASYLYYAPKKVIKNGGYIIIPAVCNEGAGKGIGEQRFFKLLRDSTLDEIVNLKSSLKAGEQRAFLMANVLKNCNVIVVGSKTPEVIKSAKMIPAKNMKEAFELIFQNREGNLNGLIVPDALITLPTLKFS